MHHGALSFLPAGCTQNQDYVPSKEADDDGEEMGWEKGDCTLV